MSPRSKKPRTCGCPAKGSAYKPTGIPLDQIGKISLYLDELEVLKLCDRDGLPQ